jgi:hypothetical protein
LREREQRKYLLIINTFLLAVLNNMVAGSKSITAHELLSIDALKRLPKVELHRHLDGCMIPFPLSFLSPTHISIKLLDHKPL